MNKITMILMALAAVCALGRAQAQTAQWAGNNNPSTLIYPINDVNVGIGTNQPQHRLHVEGTTYLDGLLTVESDANIKGNLSVGNPSLLAVQGGLYVNTTDTLPQAVFEAQGTVGADAHIRIIGKRNGCATCEVAYIDLADYDDNENGGTTFNMARITAGMQTGTGQNGYLTFNTSSNGVLNEQMRITKDGKVSIGTNNYNEAGFRLFVKEGILTEKVVIAVDGSAEWPDYVFDAQYNLRPLAMVEQFIAANHHLPGIPSAKQVAAEGIDMAQMDARLLEKVEELTLYIIQQQKQIEALQQQLNANRP